MKKLCLIKTNKIVPELNDMSGPFYNPVELDSKQIISMMNRGVKVYEVNPENKSEKILLNRFLVNKVNFVSKKETEKLTITPTTTSHSVNTAVVDSNNRKNKKNHTSLKIADFQ